jgi:hypothetical protein
VTRAGALGGADPAGDGGPEKAETDAADEGVGGAAAGGEETAGGGEKVKGAGEVEVVCAMLQTQWVHAAKPSKPLG